MTIATGVAKTVRYKKETVWGTVPAATAPVAQLLRRVSSDLSLVKETYQSAEIRSDYQIADFRHGVRRAEGTINGELSPLTYDDFFAAALRNAFQTAATSGALTNVTAAATAPHFTRAAGSWLTDGFKVGDVVRWTGWTAPAVANNASNFLITTLTATQMSGIFLTGLPVVAKASGDSVTVALAGKKVWVPETGHTDDSFSFEHWYSDVSQSEILTGCKINQLSVQLPPTGISTISMQVVGKDSVNANAEYFTTPAASTTSGVLASVNGAIYVGGTKIALLTGLSFNINGNMTQEPVVGSNTYPDIFEGRVVVSGQMTAFFEDGTLRDYFTDETEVSIYGVFTTGNAANAEFMAFTMPRVKAGGSSKDDGEKGLVQTIPFQALLNSSGGPTVNSLKTTLSIQDSLAP